MRATLLLFGIAILGVTASCGIKAQPTYPTATVERAN